MDKNSFAVRGVFYLKESPCAFINQMCPDFYRERKLQNAGGKNLQTQKEF